MEEILAEFLILPEVKLVISILASALAGGLIGMEREYRDKSAGFRTMILIAVGSCLFTIMSSIIGASDSSTTRIAAAVVSGVGFLGAGVVLKEGATVQGLTTAASIWLVASLGIAAGAGEYLLLTVVTSLSLLVLWFFTPIERWLDRLYEFVEIKVVIKNSDEVEDDILDIFDECKIKIVNIRRSREDKSERTLYIKAKMTPNKRQALSEVLVSEKSVRAFDA